MRNCLIILICFLCSSCYSQDDKTLIKNWKSYSIPKNPDTLRKYNYSNTEWAVSVKTNLVCVEKNRPPHDQSMLPFKLNPIKKDGYNMAGEISLIQVDNGYLIGFFKGEWGGSLYWFSKDGKEHYQISDDEIVKFIKRGNEYYAIQGLAHLSMSEGTIITIQKEHNKWVTTNYLKLPTAPDAIAIDENENFIVITSKSLLRIDKDKKINILVDKGIWYDGLYTNSMLIKDNNVYAGMRAGVFKYNLQTGKQEWLLPY